MKLTDYVSFPYLDSVFANKSLPIRIIYDSIRVFLLKHCSIRATALAYTSLFSIVPLIILLTSISLYLGIADLFIKHLPEILNKVFSTALPYVNEIIQRISPDSIISHDDSEYIIAAMQHNIMPILQNAQEINPKSLGLIGSLGLLVTFILFVDNIEINMNTVWGVDDDSRSYAFKAAVFIPFLIIFAVCIGLIAVLMHFLQDMFEKILMQQLMIGNVIETVVSLGIPVILLIAFFLALWLLYCYMPYEPNAKLNFISSFRKKTKERWLPAVISAAFAFTGIWVYSLLMVFLQVSLFAKWSRFYGSLAFLPLVMFWLWGLWSIVLFGNALCWRIKERKNKNAMEVHRTTLTCRSLEYNA